MGYYYQIIAQAGIFRENGKVFTIKIRKILTFFISPNSRFGKTLSENRQMGKNKIKIVLFLYNIFRKSETFWSYFCFLGEKEKSGKFGNGRRKISLSGTHFCANVLDKGMFCRYNNFGIVCADGVCRPAFHKYPVITGNGSQTLFVGMYCRLRRMDTTISHIGIRKPTFSVMPTL